MQWCRITTGEKNMPDTSAFSIEIARHGELFPHAVHAFPRIHDPHIRPIARGHGVHPGVGGHPHAEHATAIPVLLHQERRPMDGFGGDILARGCRNPESDIARVLPDRLGDTYQVVEEMPGVEVGILAVFPPSSTWDSTMRSRACVTSSMFSRLEAKRCHLSRNSFCRHGNTVNTRGCLAL